MATTACLVLGVATLAAGGRTVQREPGEAYSRLLDRCIAAATHPSLWASVTTGTNTSIRSVTHSVSGLPGVHCLFTAPNESRFAPAVDAVRARKLPPLRVPLILRGAAPSDRMSGIQWLPDRWRPVSGAVPNVWVQKLPEEFATESGTIEQLFSRGDDGSAQWMSEARWPSESPRLFSASLQPYSSPSRST